MPPPRPEWKEGKLCQYIRMKRPALVICELLRCCYLGNTFFFAQSQIKKTAASTNNMKTVIKSHTSNTEAPIILKSKILMIVSHGTSNKTVIPKAANFLVLPIRQNTANMIHKNAREVNDIAAPTWNKFFTFNIRLSKYMYGMIKTLNEIRLFRIPFFPNIRPGMDITHANTMETMGIGDHDRPPVIARSQMQHTMSPIKRIIENSAEIITFAAILFSSFLQYTYFLLFNTNYRLICSIQLLVWHKSHSIIVYGEGNMSI